MKTRDKIIYKSIELFNKEGINNISTKKIAEECNINSGNLYYYFKRKKDILEEIFNMLVEEFDSMYKDIDSKDFKKLFLRMISEQITYTHKKYKFFFRDIFILFSDYPDFKIFYKKKAKGRINQVKKIFLECIEENIFKTDIKKELDYILGIFWFNIAFGILRFENIKEDKTIKKEKLFKFGFNILEPYLTEKGKEEFEDIKKLMFES